MLPEENKELIVEGVKLILKGLGEDLDRHGIKDTPMRVAKMYSEVLDGNFSDMPRMTQFEGEKYGNMVAVHNVPFYAFCEHHMAVFLGHFSVGYIPDEKVLGLSKLVRIVRHQCKRVTIQERITHDSVEQLQAEIQPHGAICYVEAEHTCMTLRGVKSPGSVTSTIQYSGLFSTQAELRETFMQGVRHTV